MNLQLKNWSVQKKLGLLIGSFLVSFIAFVIVAYLTLAAVKVNGPYYAQIAQGRDLIADVEPASENLMEAYLTALQMSAETDAANVQNEMQRYKKVQEDFEAQHDFWARTLPEDEMKRALVVRSYEPAQEFFSICETQLFPAIRNGDQKGARALLDGRLKQLYQSHQSAIAEVVKAAHERDTATEHEVNQIADARTRLMIGIALLLVIGVAGGLGIVLSQSITRELRETISSLSVTSSEIAATVEQQERTAVHQSTAIHETTATMDELDASFNQTAVMVQTAVETARQARGVADNGIKTVQQTLDGMHSLKHKVGAVAEQILSLSEHTSQIATITNLVTDLANQTNMLALNAAVESARAGEHGKGFGVVAAEIRKLADESKKSAERISTLVQDIQAATNATVMATEEGTKTVDRSICLTQDAADAFHEVVRTSSTAADTAEQTLLSVPQQVMAVKQVLSAMEALNTSAKEAADSVSQTRIGMDSLRDASLKIRAMI